MGFNLVPWTLTERISKYFELTLSMLTFQAIKQKLHMRSRVADLYEMVQQGEALQEEEDKASMLLGSRVLVSYICLSVCLCIYVCVCVCMQLSTVCPLVCLSV